MFKSVLKVIFTVFLILVLIIGCFVFYMFIGEKKPRQDVKFGVTFSQIFAEKMGLDWKKAYLEILDELDIKRLRLVAYWPKVEPEKQEFSFEDLDWQIQKAEERNIDVILAVGKRLPRWPECHIPDWVKDESEQKQKEYLLEAIEKTVKRYRSSSAVKAWQVENEPFLRGFGHCDDLDKEFLEKEIALVRSLNKKNRPIILTASGELSLWSEVAVYADVLGTSLYHQIWNEEVGYFSYPIPPIFYHKRAKLVKWITGIDKIIIIEAQAEPWGSELLYSGDLPLKKQLELMNREKFKENVEYIRKTGYDTAYFWGAEWWYWLDRKKDKSGVWEEAKLLFNK